MTSTFPAGFSWGTGTSAYQVEGAWNTDGKAPSVWDTFQHGELQTPDGTTSDIAIDQYHRLDEDLDLLQRLGAGVHRFSVSWPRIVTDAAGAVNPRGLDYYERVVDGLLARGIAPALNLYHWDTPQWLEDRGGMLSREFADRFGELASVVADRLGDRVAQWFTMNEPSHPSLGAYVAGFLPPNRREGVAGLASVHHLLLAHGQGIQALRAAGVAGEIGTILSQSGFVPATSHPDDVRAAARAEYFEGRLFLDPMLGRGHLPELDAVLGDVVRDGDLKTIAQPMDVLGLNWYSSYTAADPQRSAVHLAELPARAAMFLGFAPLTAPLGFVMVPAPGLAWGGAHRQLTPGGLRRALDWVVETYPDHPDIVITENGVGYADIPAADGVVHDEARIAYLSWVIAELGDAIGAGVRVRGYHVWSSFDNFQYMAGFSQRFGLIHVDTDTLVRTPKDSFAWFADVVRTGRVPVAASGAESGDQRGVEIAGVRNARGIGGLRSLDGRTVRDGVLYRTASLHSLGDDGRATLASLDVQTVLDLRGSAEAQLHPDEIPFARVVRLPLHEPTDVNAGLAVGAAGGHMPLREVYAEIVRDRGNEVVAGVREVAHAPGAVLVHCTAGKDRTGVFVALLLAAIGVRDDDIVRTYAESAERLGDEFAEEVAQMLAALLPAGADVPEAVLAEMLGSPAVYIEEVLAQVRSRYGTIAAYLLAHGLTEEELRMLQMRLLG